MVMIALSIFFGCFFFFFEHAMAAGLHRRQGRAAGPRSTLQLRASKLRALAGAGKGMSVREWSTATVITAWANVMRKKPQFADPKLLRDIGERIHWRRRLKP